MRTKIVLLFAACLLVLLVGAGVCNISPDAPPELPDDEAGELSEDPPEPSSPEDGGEVPPVAMASGQPDTTPKDGSAEDGGAVIEDAEQDAADSAEAPAPSPEPEFPPYTFGVPLEEGEPAEDDSVFDNAAFLGDSRTEGFQIWGGIHTGNYFWKRGISVFGVDSEKYTFDVDGETLTMLGVLGKKQFTSVYIMIGINELGYSPEEYEEGLGAFLDQVIQLQPDAVIYLQTLPPLNDQLAIEHLSDHDRNERVDAFNEVIVRVAEAKRVVLLDTASIYRGEDGQLPYDMSADGCHFKGNYYPMWGDYLRCHVMDPARYFYWREQAAPAPDAVEVTEA